MAAVLASDVSVEEAECQVMQFIERHTIAGKNVLAGNTVHMDKRFLERYMPRIAAHLHYRIVDVSSIKELSR